MKPSDPDNLSPLSRELEIGKNEPEIKEGTFLDALAKLKTLQRRIGILEKMHTSIIKSPVADKDSLYLEILKTHEELGAAIPKAEEAYKDEREDEANYLAREKLEQWTLSVDKYDKALQESQALRRGFLKLAEAFLAYREANPGPLEAELQNQFDTVMASVDAITPGECAQFKAIYDYTVDSLVNDKVINKDFFAK